jgi:arylsulfatase A-like enzyme
MVRTIDVAPTVARLLGIQPPKASVGHVIPLGPTTR